MQELKRWYDKSEKLLQMISVLEKMPEKDLDQISKYLYQVVRLFWKEKKNNEDTLSIGREKLFGYYKSYQNNHRWYDKNSFLKSAFNIMSTFTEKELDDIVEGFMNALKDSGMYKIYQRTEQTTKK